MRRISRRFFIFFPYVGRSVKDFARRPREKGKGEKESDYFHTFIVAELVQGVLCQTSHRYNVL